MPFRKNFILLIIPFFIPVLQAIYLPAHNGTNVCNADNLQNATIYWHRESFAKSSCGCTKNCLQKCCKPGFNYNQKYCVAMNVPPDTFEVPIYNVEDWIRNESFHSERFQVGTPNCIYALEPFYYIQDNGDMYALDLVNYTIFERDQYCLDLTNGTEDSPPRLQAFVCLPQPPESERLSQFIVSIGLLISLPFFLATFIAYSLLPEKNLHIKTVMSFVMSIFLGVFFLLMVQLLPINYPRPICEFLALAIIFFFLESFLWMNVICIDIWLAFSGMKGFSKQNKKESEGKRFKVYCIYTTAVGLLHISIVGLINRFSWERSWYNPNFGEAICFIEKDSQLLLYFYGPMAILLCINSVLFAMTAWKIYQARKETKVLSKQDSQKHGSESDQRKFFLFLKLFLAMGVNWIMEVVSWAVEWAAGKDNVPTIAWIITDFLNAIYGVFIFVLFVCKPKVWRALKKRFNKIDGHSSESNSVTDSTNPSKGNTNSMDEDVLA